MKTPISNFYDAVNARTLVGLAAGAYSLDLGDLADGWDLADEILDAGFDTRAVVFVGGADVVVAFRGTQSLRNFVTDVCAERVPFWNACPGDVEVHGGFLRALNGVFGRLYAVVEKVLGPGKDRRLWITGHSLGGALAKLFAVRCKLPVAGVYTFGEPRVGNAGFRDYYDALLRSCTFRVVDGADFITRIPWLLGAYRHCGTEIFYDSDGGAHVNPGWWVKGVSDVLGSWEEWRGDGRVALLADHHVGRYMGLLGGHGVGGDARLGCLPTAATGMGHGSLPRAATRGEL